MPILPQHLIVNGHTKSQSPRPPSSRSGAGSAPKVDQHPTLVQDDIIIGGSIKESELVNVKAVTMEDAAELIASVRYLVPDWIPYGMVTGFIAEPGIGKSAFALWLARSIMTGSPWFTGAKGPKPGHILWCATENDMAITKDRMEKWCIPFDKMILPLEDDPLASVDLLSDEHVGRIESLICKYKTKAVFLDSLRGSHDGDENCSRVGKVLQNLSKIAERTQAAVIVVHHTKKLDDGEEISANSSRGSNACPYPHFDCCCHALKRRSLLSCWRCEDASV